MKRKKQIVALAICAVLLQVISGVASATAINNVDDRAEPPKPRVDIDDTQYWFFPVGDVFYFYPTYEFGIVENEGGPGIIEVAFRNENRIFDKVYIFLDKEERKRVKLQCGYINKTSGTLTEVKWDGEIKAYPADLVHIKGEQGQNHIPGLANISIRDINICKSDTITEYLDNVWVTEIDESVKKQIISGEKEDIELISLNETGMYFIQKGDYCVKGDIWFIDSEGKNKKQLTSNTYCSQAQLSPDRKKIAFVSSESSSIHFIWVVDSDGSNKKYLTSGNYLAWSPDSKKLAFFRGSTLYVINSNGSNERLLAQRAKYGFFDLGTAFWSPDGKKLVWDNQSGPSSRASYSSIWIVDTESGEIKMLTEEGKSPSWSPDSNQIAFISLRQKGVLSVYSNIGLIDSDGNNKVVLTSIGTVGSFRWSPDGEKIAFSSSGLWVMDKDGGNKVNLTTSVGSYEWSPDGEKIAFSSSGLWVSDKDGSNKVHLAEDEIDSLCWSPDSKKIAFLSTYSVSEPALKGVTADILFFDEENRIIAFEDIDVEVTINMYEGDAEGQLLWSETVRIDSYEDATSLGGRGLKIPVEDVSKLKDAKFAEVIVHTSKGDFKDEDIAGFKCLIVSSTQQGCTRF